MCGQDRLLHPPARSGRRRSADIGGLSLATRNGGHGQGWLGHSGELQTRFAELLSDMYTQTLNAVNEYTADRQTRAHLISSLDKWNFEPAMLLNEDHVFACAVILFEALFRIEGMEETVGITFTQIPPFIQHLRQIYRWQNSYHNFEHALDVLQASYSYLRSAGMVPPLSILLTAGRMWTPSRPFDSGPLMTSLGLWDLFIIYIAAIGHDVGHPGFTNLFMNNAATPLSVVFDGKSALERMHGQLLLRVMRHHGLGRLLDDPKCGVENRKLLWETVLATDMSVHDAFMQRFQDLIAHRGENTLMHRRITICQAIIKCADISNPSRPYYISQHWATALMREWNSQAILEKHHQLPTTVESSDHPLKEVHSQIFFIPKFAKPLLDLTVQAVPEMQPYAAQCDLNLKLWTARLAALQAEGDDARRRTRTSKAKPKTVVPPRQPDDYNTAFPLTLPPSHCRTPSARDREPPVLSWCAPTPSPSLRALSPLPPLVRARTPSAVASSSPSPSEDEENNSESDTASFTFSPGARARAPSSGGTSTTSVPGTPASPGADAACSDGTAAIRAAAGRAGVKTCRHAQHRNSWSPQLPGPVS
ncbi:high-affinity phosphodiesterase [Mycena maculata]|uniref:Phosphodiesterase n=1 Tax=Mycena maculata TaxID=230809 RepID=A0AAD7N1Y7_9AGAR|nr:high-affinity phosphodiesterase [Mycena maculata]